MTEEYSHWVLPVVLDRTEQPPGEIVLQPAPVSRVLVEEWVGRVIGPSIQEIGNNYFNPSDVITSSIVCTIEELRKLM